MSKYRVISGLYFPVFSPNTGKYGLEITPYLDTFHAVLISLININLFICSLSATKTFATLSTQIKSAKLHLLNTYCNPTQCKKKNTNINFYIIWGVIVTTKKFYLHNKVNKIKSIAYSAVEWYPRSTRIKRNITWCTVRY